MRFLLPLLPVAFVVLIDIYAYQAIKTVTTARWAMYAYWASAAVVYSLLLLGILTDARSSWSSTQRNVVVAIFLLLFLPKLVMALFMCIDDLWRLLRWLANRFNAASTQLQTPSANPNTIARSVFISRLALIAAALPFGTLLYGILRNAYNYQVKRVALPIPNLPDVFEGLTIAQISDLHTGSLTQPNLVQKGVDMLNALQPDLVFFTGDLVNNQADEAEPYLPIFGSIKAKLGVFSITGNHDYGDYVPWKSRAEKEANFRQLQDNHRRMGWNLLMNQHHLINRNGHQLAIIGVENWSAKGFVTHGKLAQAAQGTEAADVKLLLSHDPSHWRAEVLPKFPQINAMFAGHTHGFQMGINWGNIKWSPARLLYKEWLGLYHDAGRYLYVNPGFGFLGYPGRVGILPEITLFTLTKA